MEVGYIVLVVATAILLPVPLFIALFRDIRHKWLVFVTAPFGITPIIGYHTEEWWAHLLTLPWFLGLVWSLTAHLYVPMSTRIYFQYRKELKELKAKRKEIEAQQSKYQQAIEELEQTIAENKVRDNEIRRESQIVIDDLNKEIATLKKKIASLREVLRWKATNDDGRGKKIEDLEGSLRQREDKLAKEKEKNKRLDERNKKLSRDLKVARHQRDELKKENKNIAKEEEIITKAQIEQRNEQIRRELNIDLKEKGDTGENCERDVRISAVKAVIKKAWYNVFPGFMRGIGDIDIVASGGDRWGITVIECKAGANAVKVDPENRHGIITNYNGRNPNYWHDKAILQSVAAANGIEKHIPGIVVKPVVCVWKQTNGPFQVEYNYGGRGYEVTICSALDLPKVLRNIAPTDLWDSRDLENLLGPPGPTGNFRD